MYAIEPWHRDSALWEKNKGSHAPATGTNAGICSISEAQRPPIEGKASDLPASAQVPYFLLQSPLPGLTASLASNKERQTCQIEGDNWFVHKAGQSPGLWLACRATQRTGMCGSPPLYPMDECDEPTNTSVDSFESGRIDSPRRPIISTTSLFITQPAEAWINI